MLARHSISVLIVPISSLLLLLLDSLRSLSLNGPLLFSQLLEFLQFEKAFAVVEVKSCLKDISCESPFTILTEILKFPKNITPAVIISLFSSKIS